MPDAPPSTPVPPPSPALGRQAAAISQLVVRTMTEFTGRGPANARTSIGRDVVTVVLDEPLTKAERRLVDAGHDVEVLSLRRAFQHTMRVELIAGVEEITGRSVRAFLSDNHLDPDLATEVFVLDD